MDGHHPTRSGLREIVSKKDTRELLFEIQTNQFEDIEWNIRASSSLNFAGFPLNTGWPQPIQQSSRNINFKKKTREKNPFQFTGQTIENSCEKQDTEAKQNFATQSHTSLETKDEVYTSNVLRHLSLDRIHFNSFRKAKPDVYQKVIPGSRTETTACHSVLYWKS